MDRYKKWNVGLGVVTATLAVGVWLYWELLCSKLHCSFVSTEFIMRPLLWSSIPLTIILTSLLPFSSKLFKQWLFHIASWSIPLALLFILDEDPQATNILSQGRGLLSWILGTLIFILTVIYAIGWHLYNWRKGRVQKRDLKKLFLLVIPTALFYAIWQLF